MNNRDLPLIKKKKIYIYIMVNGEGKREERARLRARFFGLKPGPVLPLSCLLRFQWVWIEIGSQTFLGARISSLFLSSFNTFQVAGSTVSYRSYGRFLDIVQQKFEGRLIEESWVPKQSLAFGLAAWSNMAATTSAITQSQEYISFRSTVPLRRVGEK